MVKIPPAHLVLMKALELINISMGNAVMTKSFTELKSLEDSSERFCITMKNTYVSVVNLLSFGAYSVQLQTFLHPA